MEGSQQLEIQAPAAEETFPASQWNDALRQFAKRGLALCLILFVVEVGLLFLVSSAPFFPGEQSFYTGEANSLGSLVQNSTTPQLAVEIFTNNYKIALEEMIPLFGVLLFAISLYVTARVTEAIAIQDKVSALSVVLLLFLLPHSWIELPAYAVATAAGLYLLYGLLSLASMAIARRRGKVAEAGQGGMAARDQYPHRDGDAGCGGGLRIGGDRSGRVLSRHMVTLRWNSLCAGGTEQEAHEDKARRGSSAPARLPRAP